MSEPRRYDDSEIVEIFERATARRAKRPVATSEQGLTLAELEQIGSEVGIDPGRIADAAHALQRRGAEPAIQRFLGAPRSVSRTVALDRSLSDEEWSRLVVDLRHTFRAKGKVESHGDLRSWSNGNLQVHVEPAADGYQVRMTTHKGNATQFTLLGGMFSLIGAWMAVGTALGMTDQPLAKAGLLLAFGLGQIGWVRATLPGWAATRAAQMEALVERIPRLLKGSPES